MADRTQRLRDPIHGLVVFDEKDDGDMLAWRLIQTQEFQRLRRIKQLGVSEFVFPGATHSRFAHSIGVYHNARKLMRIIEREEGKAFDQDRARIATIAALLHDIGHGPFSHAFEGAREKLALANGEGKIERHERFTARLILAEDGELRAKLDEVDNQLTNAVAQLIASEDPVDIYSAVVSSSFDADRLDYLVRDRYMTGTAAGSIDEEWLIDTLSADHILIRQDDDSDPQEIPTFVFKLKGRQAAEDFLLARHRLYTQVYLHKTTRGFEQLLGALFCRVGSLSHEPQKLGLDPENPLVRFLANADSLNDYRRLDDAVVWGAIEAMTRCGDARTSDLANRLWKRVRPYVLDLTAEFGQNDEARLNAERRLDRSCESSLNAHVFKDTAPLSLYSSAGGDEDKAHKMVRIRMGDGTHREITEFEDTIISKTLMKKSVMTRFYFLDANEKDKAAQRMRGR
jgi:HD superfamily phosphohydrolase